MASSSPQDVPQDGDIEAQQVKTLFLAKMVEIRGLCEANLSNAEQHMAEFVLKSINKHPICRELVKQFLNPTSAQNIAEHKESAKIYPKIASPTTNYSKAERWLAKIVLRFLKKYPVCQKAVAQGLAEEEADIAKATKERDDIELFEMNSNPELSKAVVKLQKENDKLVSEVRQLYTLLGHSICQPDFFDDKHSLLIAECHWPFTKEDVRAAAAEWIRSNDFIPQGQITRFPEASALNMWLLSIATPEMLDYQALTDWMFSAQQHFEDVGSLRFLITILWNILLVPKLSEDHTWVGIRLLEFFVILDKDNILDATQLMEFRKKLKKQGDDTLFIPRVLLFWMRQQLMKSPYYTRDENPYTRGRCLELFLLRLDEYPLRPYGICVHATPYLPRNFKGEHHVFLHGDVDKIYKCPREDVSLKFDDNLDLVISFKGYHRLLVLDVHHSLSEITWALPGLFAGWWF